MLKLGKNNKKSRSFSNQKASVPELGNINITTETLVWKVFGNFNFELLEQRKKNYTNLEKFI